MSSNVSPSSGARREVRSLRDLDGHAAHLDADARDLQEGVESQRLNQDPDQFALFYLEGPQATETADPRRGDPRQTEADPTDRSLVYRLTRAGPGGSTDPPGPGWMQWAVIDLGLMVARYLRDAITSGGEARGLARVRVLMIQVGWTAFVGLAVAAVLYWTTRLFFDTTSIFDTAKGLVVNGGKELKQALGETSRTMRLTTVLIAAGTLTARVVVKTRLRRVQSSTGN